MIFHNVHNNLVQCVDRGYSKFWRWIWNLFNETWFKIFSWVQSMLLKSKLKNFIKRYMYQYIINNHHKCGIKKFQVKPLHILRSVCLFIIFTSPRFTRGVSTNLSIGFSFHTFPSINNFFLLLISFCTPKSRSSNLCNKK